MVLDALLKIKNDDPTITFRRSPGHLRFVRDEHRRHQHTLACTKVIEGIAAAAT